MEIYDSILKQLLSEGNYRTLPGEIDEGVIDFSSNDYLGIAQDKSLIEEFLKTINTTSFSSSASRLLSGHQDAYRELEDLIETEYQRPALLFNSGYHANTGLLPAIASVSRTLIIADKLVHASIIDGIILSRVDFKRYPHNDTVALRKIIERSYKNYDIIVVVTESVFSMDGDKSPLDDILELKKDFKNVLLYLDEAHAFGVEGYKGKGISQDSISPEDWDFLISPLGKAAASMGAFVVCSQQAKDFFINRSRSLIFSTALPPVQAKWSSFTLRKLFKMDKEREYLKNLSIKLNKVISTYATNDKHQRSHIHPLIIGDSHKTLALSKYLLENGVKGLPIRRPTVPAGTERIRFSLSANMSIEDLDILDEALGKYYEKEISDRKSVQ